MEFGILGPLEVREQGRDIELGGSKQRAVLGVLLVNANTVVSTDQIIESLWEGKPPASAPKLVQTYIWRVRKLLSTDALTGLTADTPPEGEARDSQVDRRGELIVTQPTGYLLRLEPGQLDFERFEELLARARASRDAQTA